jgi:hypothetical protein
MIHSGAIDLAHKNSAVNPTRLWMELTRPWQAMLGKTRSMIGRFDDCRQVSGLGVLPHLRFFIGWVDRNITFHGR